jgi:hypothetical protein
MARGTRKSLHKSLPTLKRNHHVRKLKRSKPTHKLTHKVHKILPFNEFMKEAEREKIIHRLTTIYSELRMYHPNSNEYKKLTAQKNALSARFASLQKPYNIVQALSQERF